MKVAGAVIFFTFFNEANMKIKKIISLLFFCVFLSSCSDVKEETPNKDISEKSVVNKEQKISVDSPRIVRLKDFNPSDSIMVGLRAFKEAKKEFIEQWNYKKDTELLIYIVDKICIIENRPCASWLDSIAYKNDVKFILDSLMQNNILDSLIEARKKEIEERKKLDCYGRDNLTKKCQEKLSKETYERVMKRLKERK